MAHGDITRMEYKVLIRRAGGFPPLVEWAASQKRVEELRAKYDVISVQYTEHVLDF